MNAFILIVTAILLPFVAIGSFTAASLLRMRDGAAAGVLPDVLSIVGFILIVALAFCIKRLHRLHTEKRAGAPDGE